MGKRMIAALFLLLPITLFAQTQTEHIINDIVNSSYKVYKNQLRPQ
jgi:hypothetical protein